MPQEPAYATDHPVVTLIALPAPVKMGFLTGREDGFLENEQQSVEGRPLHHKKIRLIALLMRREHHMPP